MVRFVCISDTHARHRFFEADGCPIPEGDILIHAGDFTENGTEEELIDFNNWLGTLPHQHKVVIAGNHDCCLDPRFTQSSSKQFFRIGNQEIHIKKNFDRVQSLKNNMTNCIYLEDTGITLNGIHIFGTPWLENFGMAFGLIRPAERKAKWSAIPRNTDVLITHTPPLGYGDVCHSGRHVGDADLISVVQNEVKPRYHIFGHIHEGYSITDEGSTTYINAASSNWAHKMANPPIVFDFEK